MMEQVFGNLLENALRFAPPGSEILVSCPTGAGPARTCEVASPTTGPACPEEERERIFEEFARVDAPSRLHRHRARPGDRARARDRARRPRMVRGDAGRGRDVRVRRPELDRRRSVSMTTVLVIEDDTSLRRALRTSLTARGRSTWSSPPTAEEGLVLVADDRPDVVLLDLGLPDLDGIEALRRMRSFSDVPVVVLTARDRQQDKIAALDAGADDYVTKPFDVEELLAAGARGAAARPPGVVGDARGDARRQARDRPRAPAGAARRRRRAPHQDRARAARAARDAPGQAAHPRVPAAAGVGPRVRLGEQLPAGLRRASCAASSATTPPTRASSSPSPASATAGSAATRSGSYPDPVTNRARETSASSPTPTGTGSGTRRSSATGCSSCTWSTTCSTCSRPTRRSPGSCSTARPRWSTTTSRCGPRPDPRLAALAAAGRLQVGPWMILMDEFMVSGETIVRNLQHGLARAEALGGDAAMRVGYLPDMFGHVAQMPQLLRLAGLEHAVVWRGVPAAIDRTAFWWRAPDGSDACAPSTSTARTPTAATSRTTRRSSSPAPAATRPSSARAALPGGGMLLMNGSDHLLPQPWLGRRGRGGQRARRTTTASRSRRSASTCARSRSTACRRGAASCARARAPTC